MHDYIINSSTIRECNFAMGTIILGKGLVQALVHTVHSTRAFCTCAWAKSFPKIVPMVKLDMHIASFLYWIRSFQNVSMCTVLCASPLAVMRYFMPKWFHKGFSVVMDWHFTHLTKKRWNRYGMKFCFFSSLLGNDFDLYYVCTSLTRNVETILVWQTSLATLTIRNLIFFFVMSDVMGGRILFRDGWKIARGRVYLIFASRYLQSQ